MSIIVREAGEADLDETSHVLASAFEQHRLLARASSHKDVVERYLDDVRDVRARVDEAILFVAVEDDRIVGAGTLYPPGRTLAYARASGGKPWPEAWASLRLLGVAPTHRRRGVGRMLVEARLSRARELGAPTAALHTSRELGAARHLVQRMGWTRAPEYDHAPAPDICAEAYVLALR